MNDNHAIACDALDFALKRGCSAARITLGSGVQSSFSVRDQLLEKVHQAAGNTLTLQLYVAGRYGSFSTNRLKYNDLRLFIEQAISGVRLLAPDPARMLPNPARYYKGNDDLQQFDSELAAVTSQEKKELAFACAQEVWEKDPRLVSVESGFSDSSEVFYMIDSQGFEETVHQSACTLTAEVALREVGDARPSAWWYESSLYKNELPTQGCGIEALKRAVAKLNPKQLASRRYPMVVEHTVAAQLLSPLIAALNGAALQQNNSFLINKLGEKIGSDLLSLTDYPRTPRAIGARLFDAEGVATQTASIFKNGVLNTYFIDTYYANKLQVAPTIGGPSLLAWDLGNGTAADLMQQVGNGVFVTGFNGGNCNSSTGDFSYGVEGFEIVNGKPSAPINEMLISGNILHLWRALCAVAKDARPCSSWRIPSLAFSDVSFSGI